MENHIGDTKPLSLQILENLDTYNEAPPQNSGIMPYHHEAFAELHPYKRHHHVAFVGLRPSREAPPHYPRGITSCCVGTTMNPRLEVHGIKSNE